MKIRLTYFILIFNLLSVGLNAAGIHQLADSIPRSPLERGAARLLEWLNHRQPVPFWVNGQFNPYLIYRKLDKAYPFVYGGKENLNMAPYPNILSPVVNTLQPTLLLSLGGKSAEGVGFGIDYAYFFNLEPNKETKHNFLAQNTLVGSIGLSKKWGTLSLTTGAGAMPIYLSRLTLSNRYFREPLFDRVPWEYFPSSDAKHHNHFRQSITDPGIYNKTAAQGIWIEASRLPGNLETKLFFGRTQLQLFPSALSANMPSEMLAGRLAKNWENGQFAGLNASYLDAWADTRKIFHDQRLLVSLDGKVVINRLELSGELGMARLRNPKTGTLNDIGLVMKSARQSGAFSFVIQAFALGRNFISLENEALNANPFFHQGGFSADTSYDNFLFPAYLNPVGIMANNRLGLDLQAEKKWPRFSVSFGMQASREWEKSGAQISFPHLVNAYSRSRFQPWQQYCGPYGRIGNRFRMSIERIAVLQNEQDIKFMNSQFLDLKWQIPAGKRNILICSYTQYGSVGISPFETLWKLQKGFLQSGYQELELMVPVFTRWTLSGYAGWQQNRASRKTEADAETGNPLSQTGTGYGLGLDYDVAKNFGIYLRHRWMDHRDGSFLQDRFSGQETVAEIKISF